MNSVKLPLYVTSFLVFVVDDVRTYSVQETRIVRDNHGRNGRLRDQILFQPGDIFDVQVVGRFVQSKMSAFIKIALAKASFIFQPPDNAVTAPSCIASVN